MRVLEDPVAYLTVVWEQYGFLFNCNKVHTLPTPPDEDIL